MTMQEPQLRLDTAAVVPVDRDDVQHTRTVNSPEFMIVNDRLVYLRLQKCASTAVSALLLECVGGERRQPSHRRLDFDPGSRTVFGSVRDPWSWYVSVWSFGCAGKGLSRRLTGSRPRRRAVGRLLLDEMRGERRSPTTATL